MEQRLKDLLSDLGRRTLRGVKPCPKCGTYNGTRGFSCKNKSCDVVFKVADERKKKTTDASRIATENQNAQIFSVRLRDKGPDYRDFVQLTTEVVDTGNGTMANVHNAECFVESCSSKIDSFNLLTVPTCQHVQATLNCHSETEVLPIKTTLIQSLNIPPEIKDELWTAASDESHGVQLPIVQRVSKTIFVVKCAGSNKFPLGYLHCSFVETRNKSGTLERKFICPCRKVKPVHIPVASPCNGPSETSNMNKECVHFFACILAFISDEKLMNEFAHHVQVSNVLSVSLDSIDELSERQLVVHFEVMPQGSDEADLLCGDVRVLDSLVLSADDGISAFRDDVTVPANVNLSLPVGINMNDLLNGTLEVVSQQLPVTPVISAEEAAQIQRGKIKIPALKRIPRSTPGGGSPSHNHQNENAPKKSSALGLQSTDDTSTAGVLHFEQWLASVTERINQTMHFGMAGTPEPLVYQIPHSFFDLFRDRISSGGRRKRLPNSTVVFQRKDRPPFGSFTKYTWLLNNPMHVKQIFDTSLVQLELSRSWVENHDGSFDPFVPKAVDPVPANHPDSNLPTLKPLELRTFIKIGCVEEDAPPVPFVIEWIPDLLAATKFGEVSFQFQFGHQRHPQSANERVGNSKRVINGTCSSVNQSLSVPRRKKMKLPVMPEADVKDLQNLRLDFDGVAPLNDSEFHELTKSIP